MPLLFMQVPNTIEILPIDHELKRLLSNVQDNREELGNEEELKSSSKCTIGSSTSSLANTSCLVGISGRLF